MKTCFLALMLIAPASASAAPRPYVVRNGRSAAARPSPARATPARSFAFAEPARRSGGQDVVGESRSAFAVSLWRPASFRPLAGRARRATDGGSTDQAPPYFFAPGALIRTEGQLPRYEDAGPARTFSVEGGVIALDPAKARPLGGSGVAWGRPDAPPSVAATTGAPGAAGGNGATEKR